MTDPLRRLKFLPWRSLLQVSALIAFILVFLEFSLGLGYKQSPVIRRILSVLFAPSLELLVTFSIAVGSGVMAVYLLERYQQVMIDTASLWALVLCLLLVFFVKSLLLPSILMSLDEMTLVGVIVGVFWKGRSYWR